jgi:hypothetical protein
MKKVAIPALLCWIYYQNDKLFNRFVHKGTVMMPFLETDKFMILGISLHFVLT